jgi:hypothetical protein
MRPAGPAAPGSASSWESGPDTSARWPRESARPWRRRRASASRHARRRYRSLTSRRARPRPPGRWPRARGRNSRRCRDGPRARSRRNRARRPAPPDAGRRTRRRPGRHPGDEPTETHPGGAAGAPRAPADRPPGRERAVQGPVSRLRLARVPRRRPRPAPPPRARAAPPGACRRRRRQRAPRPGATASAGHAGGRRAWEPEARDPLYHAGRPARPASATRMRPAAV